ncbi:MAG: hypothetical protein RL295_469 [Pseudomonadota bacterium]
MPQRLPTPSPYGMSLALAVLLCACGGGGSSSNSTTLSGAVIDGYIEGAKVCLDVNANGLCESSEPTATTNSLGQYKLDAGNTNTMGLNIVAEIPDTAKDSDDEGLTLRAAGKSAYTMATSSDQPTVVTPVTTMIVGKVKAEGLTTDVAKLRVFEEFGLPSDTNPYVDHIEKGNASVHGAAKQIAAQLQQAQSALPSTTKAEERWSKTLDALKLKQKENGDLSNFAATTAGQSPVKMPASLSNVATVSLFTYKMPGVMGKQIDASAMLFSPKNVTKPNNGWPLIVFGHGTAGVAAKCAPSVTMNESGQWDYADLVAALVSRGYVVVAPDYEGLGSADLNVKPGHPYLDLGSAGRSMALAAVVAKRTPSFQLSGDWATWGHSQGGHAALAGAQFASLAKLQEPGLNFKGAIAVAPASNLLNSLNAMWSSIQSSSTTASDFQKGYETVGVSNLYTAYLVKGTQSTPHPIDATKIFGTNMQTIYNTAAGSQCIDEFAFTIGKDLSTYGALAGSTPAKYPGFINAAVNTPSIIRTLSANEPGQVKLPGKILVVQGSADTTVLPSSTNTLISTMKSKGTDVTLSYHDTPTATHSGVLGWAAAQAAMAQHLSSLFAAN